MLGSFCEAPRSRVPLIARDEPPKRPTAPLRTHHERSSGGVPPNATALWVEIREVTHETSPGRVPRADRPHHRRHRGRVRLLGHRIGPRQRPGERREGSRRERGHRRDRPQGQGQERLEGSKASIAAATGLSESQVDQAIEQLDIDGWQAASLPSTATATGTIDGNALGINGTVTTYDDPGYVSVEVYGQTVTLAVPESAQAYLPYLAYVQ